MGWTRVGRARRPGGSGDGGRWTRAGARLRRGVAVVGCAVLSGCYSLVPESPRTATAPQRVRVFLTEAGAARAAAVFGAPMPTLDGRLVAVDEAGLSLAVPVALVPEGLRTTALRQVLVFPQEEIVGMQRRELDRGRTAALIGVGAVVLGAAIVQILGGESGGTTTPPPGGAPAEVRRP